MELWKMLVPATMGVLSFNETNSGKQPGGILALLK
jgi:hypothetical protein